MARKIVDLTVTLSADTPVYPGDPKPEVKPGGVLSDDGFNSQIVTTDTHVGTHIDAPIHMVEGGKQLKDYEISTFVGRGRYVRVENRTFDLDAVKAADIQAGDIVLFHTGLAMQYGRDDAYFENYPQVPEEVAQYLVDKKVAMVGMDMCSPDSPDFPIHKLLLSNDVLIIENLTGLEQLAGAQEFTVYALPLKLEFDAAPARVIAQVKS